MERFCVNALLSVAAVILLYLFLWKQRGGNLVITLLVTFTTLEYEQAFYIYHNYFRGYKEIFFGAAILLVFIVLLWRLFRWICGWKTNITGRRIILWKKLARKLCSPCISGGSLVYAECWKKRATAPKLWISVQKIRNSCCRRTPTIDGKNGENLPAFGQYHKKAFPCGFCIAYAKSEGYNGVHRKTSRILKRDAFVI